MSTTYINPDAPNPEITDAAVRSMLMQNQPQNMGGYGTCGYYPGAGTNPFAPGSNLTSVPTTESRANVGNYNNMGYMQPYQNQYAGYQMPATNPGIAPPWNSGATYDQLTQMNTQALAGYNYAQPAYQQYQPVSGYNGYPIGIDPNNWIFEYMKNNTAPRNSWGTNCWTSPKPIEQPPIDWTQKPQQNPYGGYEQYGMGGVTPQTQPMLPPNFAFPQVQESWLDVAKKNWKNL